MKTLIKNQIKDNNTKTVALKKPKPYILSLAVICYMILAITTLSSCSKDDAPSNPAEEVILPTITLQSGSTGVFEGVIGSPTSGTLDYTIMANTPNGFSQMIIEKIVEGNVTTFEIIHEDHPNYVENASSFSYSLNHVLSEGNADSNISFKATVTDSNGNTANLDFASAIVKRPLLSEYMVLRVENPVVGLPSIPYFMYAKENVLKKETITGVTNDNADAFIFAVLSYNDGSGLYLSSPTTTLESQLLTEFNIQRTTKFKEQTFDVMEFNNYTIFDVYEMDNLYNAVPFNSHEEKAEGLLPGKTFSFLTYQNHTGIIHIREVEVINGEFYVDVEVFIQQ